MSIEHLDLADYIGIASEVTGLDEGMVVKIANLDLADSALHAPAAGFGDEDFYPGFVEKAAVLVVRLAKNHPLPDRNSNDRARRPRVGRDPEVAGFVDVEVAHLVMGLSSALHRDPNGTTTRTARRWVGRCDPQP